MGGVSGVVVEKGARRVDGGGRRGSRLVQVDLMDASVAMMGFVGLV